MSANSGSNPVSFKLIKALGGRKVGPGIIESPPKEQEAPEQPSDRLAGRVPRDEIEMLVRQALDERREIDMAVRQALDGAMEHEPKETRQAPGTEDLAAMVRQAVEEALQKRSTPERRYEEDDIRRIEEALKNCKMHSGAYVDFTNVFDGIANIVRKEISNELSNRGTTEGNGRTATNGVKQAISDAIDRRTEAFLSSMRQKIEEESLKHVDDLLGQFMPIDNIEQLKRQRRSASTGGDFRPGNTPVQPAVDVNQLSKSIAEAVREQIGGAKTTVDNLDELDKRMGRLMEAVEKAELIASRMTEYAPARRYYRRGSSEHYLDKQHLGILEDIFKNNVQLQTPGTEMSVDEAAVQPAEAVPQTEGALQ